jgi:hypothetical protein
VLFESPESDGVKLARRLEKILSETFKPYSARSRRVRPGQTPEDRDGAPKGFGRKPETYRYDVIYLMDGLNSCHGDQTRAHSTRCR